MDFAYSPKVQELRERVTAFMDAYVYPAEPVFERQVSEGDRWQPTAIMEELKAGEGRGLVEPVPAGIRTGRWPDQP